jgi:hypothetical protein
MLIGHPLEALAFTHDRGRELRAQAASRRGRASKMRPVLEGGCAGRPILSTRSSGR